MNFKKLTDEELILCYKKLNKIIEVVDGDTAINEKVLNKLPKLMIDYINGNRKRNTNPFHIAGLYGDITSELAIRFIKQHSKI